MYRSFYRFTSFINNAFMGRNRKRWLWVKENIKTPYELSLYFVKYFVHVGTEFFNAGGHPETFEKDRRGVCIDFAYYAYYLLSFHGYDCNVYGMWETDFLSSGHAICIYKKGKEYGFFSNKRCYSGYTSVDQIFSFNFKKYELKKVLKGNEYA